MKLLLLMLCLGGGCGRSGDSAAPPDSAQPNGSSNTAVDQRNQAPESPANTLRLASQSLARGDVSTANDLIKRYLLVSPDDPVALELAGDIGAHGGDVTAACNMYRAAAEGSSPPSPLLLDKWSQALMRDGRPFEAVEVLQQSIVHHPNLPQTRFDLAGLATMIGVTDVAVPSLQWLAQHRHGDPESLLVLADPGAVEPDEAVCQGLMQQSPDNLRPAYGLAKLDAMRGDWQAVLDRLAPVLDRHKDFVPAFVLYGRALVELGRLEQLPQWHQGAPSGVESSADYWLVAAEWAQHQGHHDQATRAFLEAIHLNERGRPEALGRLLVSLKQIGQDVTADKVAEQISRYGELRDALKTHLERKGTSQRAAMRVAEAMVSLGRIWEAEAWARLAAELPTEPIADLRERYLAIRSQLTVDTPWQLAEKTIAAQTDPTSFPIVQWGEAKTERSRGIASRDAKFFFSDEAKQRGWDHTCDIAPQAVEEGHWIYQSVGGGVGVIDFDLDGWPDLAAARLNGQPLQSNSSPNRLSRNLNGTFTDVTELSHYLDTGFSQGIAVGDFNDDGFPDLLDGNIGQNRLFRNNGDGTFQEVTLAAGLSGQAWTTSAVIADLSGDGIADLFEVNYCSGKEPYERPCRNAQGYSTCPPLLFEAEPDRFWRGVGDGTFVDATASTMNQTSPGRGLGVIVGAFDERSGLDLYVANDMTVNHLWSGESDGGNFRLADLGAIRGLGFNSRSDSQASMGMAAGDPDGDGDIDFFLTHFADDYNTYYEQVAPGLWIDRSFQVGFPESSMKLLGFGTEWVDFDNDGSLELIVANGHIDDVGRSDVSYYMPAQLYRRESDGRWRELNRQTLGDYFAADHLGRALAVLDADRDRRNDVAITHLYDPVSLLINQTETADSSIGLVLKATQGQRDAIGALVTMKIGDRTATYQLTAGDGYMCSDERRIHVGLGQSDAVTDVAVTWPSGVTQTFGTLQGGRDYLLVEGSSNEAFELP